MRLGSGSERRRCIMQFSLAAGSDSAAGDSRNMVIAFTMSPHTFYSLSLMSTRKNEAAGEFSEL